MNVEQIIRDPRKYAVVFESGEEVTAGLKHFAEDHEILSATIEGTGVFERCTLGYFDWSIQDYKKIRIDEQVEVLLLLGNFALHAEKPVLHMHLVVAKSDGTAHGGHLLEAVVRPAVEVVVTESPERLIRRWDEASQLALIEI